MSVVDNLTTAVTNQTTVEASAVALIQGLAAEVKAAAANGDMDAVQALTDKITANSAALAAAVSANTPASAPTPAPAPASPAPAPAAPVNQTSADTGSSGLAAPKPAGS